MGVDCTEGIVKFLKLRGPENFAVITLKFEQGGLAVMCPKDPDGMANSVDPDQSDLDLHCLP